MALNVLGSYLCSRSKLESENALEKMKVVPQKKIQNFLRINYDGLDDNKKQIFLDIACFFNEEDNDNVDRMLNVCGLFASIGIRVLIDRSLKYL